MNGDERVESSLRVFDYKAVSNRLLDDKSLVAAVAKVFIDDMSQQITELIKLVERGDLNKISIQAHKIKGSSANMGGMILGDHAKMIEMAGKSSDIETVQNYLPKIEQSFTCLKEEIQKVLF